MNGVSGMNTIRRSELDRSSRRHKMQYKHIARGKNIIYLCIISLLVLILENQLHHSNTTSGDPQNEILGAFESDPEDRFEPFGNGSLILAALLLISFSIFLL